MKTYDIITIGGGPMGLATTAELAKSKKKTLLIEQYNFINEKGSSAGLSRQFRLEYAQEYMARLALDSIPYCNQLQATTEDVLIGKVGSLWFGEPDMSSQEGGIQAAMDVMDKLKIPYTPLTSQQIEQQYPFQNLPEDYHGFFQKDGGIIDFNATQKALLKICKASAHVDLLDNTPVVNIESRDNGEIIVSVDGEDFVTEKLVITPGSYVNDILKFFGLSINIEIWEMSSAYYKKTQNITLPTWFVFQKPQNTSLFYGFPEVDWGHEGYIRVAPDIPDRIIKDPSQRTGVPSQKSLDLTNNWVKNNMTGLEPTPEFTATCLITLSNNDKELLLDHLPDSVPNHKDIVLYTGGWAAKFVPLIGKILSDLVLKNTTEYDISPFSIDFSSENENKNNEFKRSETERRYPH